MDRKILQVTSRRVVHPEIRQNIQYIDDVRIIAVLVPSGMAFDGFFNYK